MQVLKIYAVYDKKAVAYNMPFYYPQKGQALRAFEEAVNNPSTPQQQNPLNKHPEDFSLFEIGEWNDTTGIIKALPNPVPVEEALNVKK